MKKYVYKSINQFHKERDLAPPENPFFSVLHTQLKPEEFSGCEEDEDAEPISVSCQYYTISFKNIISGELVYGRTKYDCSNGTLLFTAPDQTMIYKGIVFSSEAYHIAFHQDYIRGYELYKKIKKYHFFDYQVNEALHLSPKEEEIIKSVFNNIANEYNNNQDEFSKEIILSHLETLLKYADRFYKRQFLNRKEINTGLFKRFTHILEEYFAKNQLEEKGIPTVKWMAGKLGVSYRYMSDTIKAETGKTAIDQINLFLIDEAKNMLLSPNASVSETAYKLGFEYPQYFSRLFKKRVGFSPTAYRNSHMLN